MEEEAKAKAKRDSKATPTKKEVKKYLNGFLAPF
jgi:hypothetical protein